MVADGRRGAVGMRCCQYWVRWLCCGGIETTSMSVRRIRGDSVVGNLLEGLFESLRIGRHVAHWGWMAVGSAEC